MKTMRDVIHYKTEWGINRYANEADRKARRVYSDDEAMRLFGAKQFSKIDGNLLLNEGINELFTLICSSSGTKYDNTNAQLGTGTSSTAADPADSALTAGVWKAMDVSYPTYGTSQQAVWKSTFGSSDANQAWNEFSVRNGASADKMLNRKVSAQGTKTAGQTWELTLTITLS
jgi:hypothetical protein